jgi:hypothetical protein
MTASSTRRPVDTLSKLRARRDSLALLSAHTQAQIAALERQIARHERRKAVSR